jgi:hypothetical protein
MFDKKFKLTFFLALFFFIGGCSNVGVKPEPTISVLSDPSEPTMTSMESAILVSAVATPNPEFATVTGRLVRPDGNPAYGVVVFLERTRGNQQLPRILYAPPNDQPQAVTSDSGEFVISEIPEGEYIVVAFLPPADLQVFTEPYSDKELFIEAKPNKVIDIGLVKMSQMQPSESD